MMEWLPHVTVATVVEKDGKFLLVQEYCNNRLVYNQPAGHLDPDETLEQAAIRETFEESGWHIKLNGIVGLALYTSPFNQVTYHRTTFYGQVQSHDSNHQLDDGIKKAVWMSYEEMLAAADQMRSWLVIKSVEQYRAGHRHPIEMILS